MQATVIKMFEPLFPRNHLHRVNLISYENMRQVITYSGQSVVFQPNNIRRHFLMVPEKATWAVVKVRSHESNAVGKFVLHTVQLLPKTIVKGKAF